MKALMTRELKTILAATLLCSTSVLAQDMLVSETEEILNSERIDIDGEFKRESAADRIEKMRKRLEAQNEEMVQKKIEDIRIKQEKELSNKLQKAFQGNMQALDDSDMEMTDDVQVVQAAPQAIIAPAPEEEKKDFKNAIIPYFGIKQFNGDQIDNFESAVNVGLTFENEVSRNFRVGIGATYTTLDFTDSIVEGFNFNNNLAIEQDVAVRNLNLNLTGKFFIVTESSIRPYVGLGLGYNRMDLSYDQTYRGEDIDATGNNVTGSGSVGVEFAFASNLGLNIDFTYQRAISSGFENRDVDQVVVNPSVNAYKARLDQYGNALEQSDVGSLNVGFLIKF